MSTPEVPREPLMSLDELRAKAAALHQRKEELEEQRKRAVDKNVTNREMLIGQVKSSDERLSAVRDTIKQYQALEESGGQLSDDDQKLFSDMQDEEQQLVAFLNNANTQIESQTESPGVKDKLQDAAGEEDRERTAKERLAELEREYVPRFEQLADEAWEQINRLIDELPFAEAQRQQEQNKIGKRIGQLIVEASHISPVIEGALSSSWEGVSRESLEVLKNRFGAFQFKERKAVDYLLKHVSDFEEYGSATEAIKDLRRQRWEIASSAKETFYPRFKALIEEVKQRAEERGIPPQLYNYSTLDIYQMGRVVDRRIFSKLKKRGPDGQMLADRDAYMKVKLKMGGQRSTDDRLDSVSSFVWAMTTGHGY